MGLSPLGLKKWVILSAWLLLLIGLSETGVGIAAFGSGLMNVDKILPSLHVLFGVLSFIVAVIGLVAVRIKSEYGLYAYHLFAGLVFNFHFFFNVFIWEKFWRYNTEAQCKGYDCAYDGKTFVKKDLDLFAEFVGISLIFLFVVLHNLIEAVTFCFNKKKDRLWGPEYNPVSNTTKNV